MTFPIKTFLLKQFLIISLLSCSVIFGTHVAWGQVVLEKPDTKLTLQQAYDLALKNNLRIQAAQKLLPESQADIITAKLRINPNLSTDLGPIEKTYRVAGLEQTFEPPGKRTFRIRVAKDQYAQTQAVVSLAIFQVFLQIHQAYNTWVAASMRLGLQQSNVQILQSLTDVAQKRFQYGDVPEMDVIQARLLLSQALNDALQGQSDVAQAKTQLAGLLNMDTLNAVAPSLWHTQTALNKMFPSLPERAVIRASVMTTRPELKVNAAAITTEKDRIKLYKRTRIPDLTLQVGYDLIHTAPNYVSGAYVAGKIDIPVFDRQQGNIAHSKATYDRLLKERGAITREIDTGLSVQYQHIQALEAQIRRYQQSILPQLDTVDYLAQRSYEMGQTGIGEALLAHQNTIAIRKQVLQTVTDYQQALIDLETVLGYQLPIGGNTP